jgi:hypothetical protein
MRTRVGEIDKRIRTSGGRLVSPDNDCVGTYERKPIFCAWPSYIPTANSAVGMGIHGLGRSGVPAGGAAGCGVFWSIPTFVTFPQIGSTCAGRILGAGARSQRAEQWGLDLAAKAWSRNVMNVRIPAHSPFARPSIQRPDGMIFVHSYVLTLNADDADRAFDEPPNWIGKCQSCDSLVGRQVGSV